MRRLEFFSDAECQMIHDASMRILAETGVRIQHRDVCLRLSDAGALVDKKNGIVRFPEEVIWEAIRLAEKRYTLYGRDGTKTASFGQNARVFMSSPGQSIWVENDHSSRREPTLADLRDAIIIGDALDHIDIVGAMAVPTDIPVTYRDVFLAGELVKGTAKPTRCFVANARSGRFVLEIYEAVAGGREAHRARPMTEAFVEPVSPLCFAPETMEILAVFTEAGLPVNMGSMPMAAATGPATLAGTMALANAEILAGITCVQAMRAGTPVTYGGIPHIMDLGTMLCSFGAPEVGLMAVGMTQMAKFYGFPAYVNAGLTDANSVDAQAGMEKAASMLLALLAGADTFGHLGVCGADQGASLTQLVVDDEIVGYTKKILAGCKVNTETLAVEAVARVGIGGGFLDDEHTLAHFRSELWFPRLSLRSNWEQWRETGGAIMQQRAAERVSSILAARDLSMIETDLAREIDRIVAAARQRL